MFLIRSNQLRIGKHTRRASPCTSRRRKKNYYVKRIAEKFDDIETRRLQNIFVK